MERAEVIFILAWIMAGFFCLGLAGCVVVVFYNILDGVRVLRTPEPKHPLRVEPEIIEVLEPGAQRFHM